MVYSFAVPNVSTARYSRGTDDDDRRLSSGLLNELHAQGHCRPDVLHVEALGLLVERGRHRAEHDLGVEVVGAVVGVAAGDAGVVHLLDDGRHHVEPAHREPVVLVRLRVRAANHAAAHLDDALENHVAVKRVLKIEEVDR